MYVTTKQREEVDKRINFVCITNSTQRTENGERVINVHACIAVAFMLGARFGIAHPNQAGDYMARWLGDFSTDTGTAGLNHERAMAQAIRPILNESYEDE